MGNKLSNLKFAVNDLDKVNDLYKSLPPDPKRNERAKRIRELCEKFIIDAARELVNDDS